jgi:hypothetical protein
MAYHDPEDGSCDVFSGDYKIGVCQCGRTPPTPSPPVRKLLPDGYRWVNSIGGAIPTWDDRKRDPGEIPSVVLLLHADGTVTWEPRADR